MKSRDNLKSIQQMVKLDTGDDFSTLNFQSRRGSFHSQHLLQTSHSPGMTCSISVRLQRCKTAASFLLSEESEEQDICVQGLNITERESFSERLS